MTVDPGGQTQKPMTDPAQASVDWKANDNYCVDWPNPVDQYYWCGIDIGNGPVIVKDQLVVTQAQLLLKLLLCVDGPDSIDDGEPDPAQTQFSPGGPRRAQADPGRPSQW